MNSGLQAFIQKQREIKKANAMIETKELSQDTLLEEEIKNEPTTKEINRTQVEKPLKVQTQVPILQKPKKVKKFWTDSHEFISLSLPKLITDPRIHYKYKVTLEYIDDKRKTRELTINFGKKSETYLVENSSFPLDYIRKKVESYKKCQTPFHKNYYVIELLWKSTDLYDNYAQLIKKTIQENAMKKKQQGK